MSHEELMRLALEEAGQAAREGEVPVGAVLARQGQVIARAHNLREQRNDPTAHAELLCIRQAAELLHTRRLNGLTLYVTLEPCPMCAGAMVMAQLAELTGFTASTTSKQFSDSIMDEYNATGMIGVYGGCKVVNLVNPLIDGTDTPVFDTNKLFILPSGIDAGMRPLKVLFEGDVTSKDNQDIDDMVYEVRLDQYIGAGIVVGDRPYIGVYQGN